MAFSFGNIGDAIEKHPVMASIIFGTAALAATVIITKRMGNSSKSSSSTQTVCSDANGNVVDCNTGLPVGTSGGFSLQPVNNNSDVISAIGQLGQTVQNLINAQNTSNTSGNQNNPPPQSWYDDFRQKIQDILKNTVGQINPPPNNPPPNNPPVNNPPAPVQHRYVTVATWTANNTPWNSTLWGIAHHYGESLSQIEKLNPQIKNPNLIYPGQKVYY